MDNGLNIDTGTCWYSKEVINEMNRFYDIDRNKPEVVCHFKHFQNLLKLVPLPQGAHSSTLVDIGCGTGYLQEFCGKWSYIGVDMPEVIEGCLKRNYPETNVNCEWLDIVKDPFPHHLSIYHTLNVLNGVLDVMQYPIFFLEKALKASSHYLIIHRQEITEQGQTTSIKKPSYNSYTYHSIISRRDFNDTVLHMGFEIVAEEKLECGFPWENGGSSFLLKRKL